MKKNMCAIEITGQSCSGKTSFSSKKVSIEQNLTIYKIGNLRKILNFAAGLKYLGASKAMVLMNFALKEKGPLFFRINIFRNAVSKFGIFTHVNYSTNNSKILIIDEGLSHLPFLFLETNTKDVVSLIANELSKIEIIFLIPSNRNVIKCRMKIRGHKRLKFLNIDDLINKNNLIEQSLLIEYPDLCANFTVSEYVEDF